MKRSIINSRNRQRWLAGLVVGEIILGALWLGGCVGATQAKAADAAPRASGGVPVSMAKAAVQDVDISLDALGTVTPLNTVTVTSRVAGVLQEVRYTEGQTVKKDDLLAVIDPRPYQAVLAQTEGQLARDQAQLANARLDLDRYRSAVHEHAIPEQQVATQQAVVGADEGVVKIDQGLLDAAQLNVDYTRITSPIEGRVGLRMIDAGNNIPANGTGGLVVITQLQPITVVFTLAQETLPQVMEGMRGGQPLRLEAFDRDHAKAIASGQLLTIDNQVDQASGTYRLKGTFTNDDMALWPGELMSLRLVIGARKNAITVPARAVQQGPNGNYIFVVKPDMTVELRNVEVPQTNQEIAVISKGLSAGEQVVVDGQYRLEAGTKVALQTPDAVKPQI
jgi:membrane fusion protein, multidrug efflux system